MALIDPDDYAPMSEISVTPLVDVMLVLLVIFMITAPFVFQAVPVNLPATAPVDKPVQSARAEILIDAAGGLTVDGSPLDPGQLEAYLAARRAAEPELAVQVKADRQVAYGHIAEVMASVNRAGIARMSFVTARTGLDAGR